MEGHCSTGQSPQWAVVPMEEEEEEDFEELLDGIRNSANMHNDSSHVKIASPKLANKFILIV